MASSLAAACSSKSKRTQKRLRSARPQARLMRRAERARARRAACRRSRRRSARRRRPRRVGTTPRRVAARRAGSRRSARAASSSRPHSSRSQLRRRLRRRRGALDDVAAQAADLLDSSMVRPGASPSQNGIVGGAPWASSTRTSPRLDAPDPPGVGAEQEDVARHALDGAVLVDGADHGVVRARPRPGSRPSSGMAPPLRMAVMRAPRRPRSTPLMRSR